MWEPNLPILHANGRLLTITTQQFNDEEAGMFLNGRQVEGRCPIQGCASEKGYADECALGIRTNHPSSSIREHPLRQASGDAQCQQLVSAAPRFQETPSSIGWRRLIACPGSAMPRSRQFSNFSSRRPCHVKKEHLDELDALHESLPLHERIEGAGKSVKLVFQNLADRKRLVPPSPPAGSASAPQDPGTLPAHRQLEWGVPVPEVDEAKGLTFWVWPESLWAPISFTQAWLEKGTESR